jgi:hypothetical protein
MRRFPAGLAMLAMAVTTIAVAIEGHDTLMVQRGNSSAPAIMERNPGAAIAAIIQTVSFVGLLIGLIAAICLDGEQNIMSKWTKSSIVELHKQFPDKNVFIAHTKYEYRNLQGWDKAHYELDTKCFGRTKGYDIFVFDSGEFELKGDGGWANWAFVGNRDWTPGSSKVVFKPINRGTCQTKEFILDPNSALILIRGALQARPRPLRSPQSSSRRSRPVSILRPQTAIISSTVIS